MKKDKIINKIIIILTILTLILRLISKDLYNKYNLKINYISILLVLISSIYFTIKLKFIQFNIIKISKTIINSTKEDITALFMTLGSKIGVGSIAGTSLAIYISGPGVLLWIWIITILSSILTYCETYLGSKYKNGNNGGTFYYIKKGLKNETLAITYTIILIFIYAIGFVGIQSNTIIKSIEEISNIDKYLIIIIVLISISIMIFNKIQNIIKLISKIVPLMCIIYILSGIIIILKIDNIKEIFKIIISSGLNNKSIIQIIIVGLQKGIFATESGIGTSSISTSICNSSASKQGIFQVLGVHFISLIIITITGVLIISNNTNYYTSNINGIEIIMSIYYNYYGIIGKITLCIIIILFAISTILSAYYFTVKGIEFIKNEINHIEHIIIKIIIIIFLFLGMIIKSSLIWSILDTLIMFLLIINIYSLIKLRAEIK